MYLRMYLPILLAVLWASCAKSWGTLGHAVVAGIAEHYLEPETTVWIAGLLGPGVRLPSVASWADSYRYTKAGRFSAPFQ